MSDDRDEGMGLDEFLNYDPDAEKGGGGQWLKPWKKRLTIDVWLHTESKIRGVWGHQIPHEIEVDEKNQAGEKTGRKTLKLSWPRFVSPDTATIHANQYFRDDNRQLRELFSKDPKTGKLIGGSQATAFMRDPFLILREYLWHAIEKKILGPDDVVFEWVDHKNKGELIQWTAGEMSRQVKRGFKNRGHSCDAKLEYIFVVVDNAKPEEGPKITRETKLVGDKMRDCIKREIESRGESGDPFRSPYSFRWKYIPDSNSPMNSYDAFRVDLNPCTPEIWRAIGGTPDPEQGEHWDIIEAPDTAEYARVNDGDPEKIRQIFERAAQVELPLDAIFSDDWEVRKSVVTGAVLSVARSAATPSRPASAPASRPNPGAAPGGAARPSSSTSAAAPTKPVGPARPGATKPAEAAAPPAAGPQPRRKKKVEEPAAAPPPKAEPEVERIPCDGPDGGPACGYMLLPTEAKCPQCGTEYDIGDAVPADPPPPKAQPAAPSGAKRPAQRSAEEQAELAATAERKCIACGDTRLEKVDGADGPRLMCTNCGCDQGDDLPF